MTIGLVSKNANNDSNALINLLKKIKNSRKED